MITKLENGVTVIEMGQGTLYPSITNITDNTIGICFSNSKESLNDSVIITINSMQGMSEYVSPLITLLEEFERLSNDTDKEAFKRDLANLKTSLEPFLPKKKID